MPRPKSLGSYVPLSTSYYRDDAILEAGERAELLFVRGLAYCAESPTDGYISDRQLVAVVAIGMRDALKRASVLVNLGLWQKVDGGYVIRSWLKWNKSAEDIGRHLKKDRERKANGKRSDVDVESVVIPDGIRADSGDQYTSVHDSSVHDSSQGASGGSKPEPATEIAEPPVPSVTFDDFWEIYPRKDDRKKALEKWAQVVKSGADPVLIVKGAMRYRDDPNRGVGFTKLGATWLNGSCWENPPLPPRQADRSGGRPDTTARLSHIQGLKIGRSTDPPPEQLALGG